MAKRRANGEGSLRKRKDGRWEGLYTAGTDPVTGKAIVKSVLGKTQAEVKEKLKKAIAESENLDIKRSGMYTVGERNRCKDCIQYAGTQQRRIHPRHLHPCHEQGAGAGSGKDGKPAEAGALTPQKY